MEQRFTAVVDFAETIDRRRTKYRKGQGYKIKPDNAELAAKAKKWAEQGLILWGAPGVEGVSGQAARAEVSGTGRVKPMRARPRKLQRRRTEP